MEEERVYENVLSLASLFANEDGINSVFEEILNVVKEHEELRKEKGIVFPCAFYDDERERVNINFNSLIKAVARAYSNGDLMMRKEIENDLLIDIHSKKTYEVKIKEGKRNKGRVFLIYGLMQNVLGLCYVGNSQINTTYLTGNVQVGKDYLVDMIFKIGDEATQYKVVPLNTSDWIEHGVPSAKVEELKDILGEISYVQDQYGRTGCNKFWKENSKLKKTFFE